MRKITTSPRVRGFGIGHSDSAVKLLGLYYFKIYQTSTHSIVVTQTHFQLLILKS